MPQLAARVRYRVCCRTAARAIAHALCRLCSVLFAGGVVVGNIRLPCKAVVQGGDILGFCMGGAGTGVSPLMLPPDACQFAAGMYRIAPLSFLHLFSLFAYITPEKGRFAELLSKLPIKFGNKAKSAFLPYSCLDIIQLGMKKRTAVIYRRPFLVIPNCRVKPSAEPRKRKTPKSFRDFSVFPYLVGV